MKKKIKGFFNDEDKAEINRFLKDLLKEKKLEHTQYLESGGLRVEFEDKFGDTLVFNVMRLVATIEIKEPKKVQVEHARRK